MDRRKVYYNKPQIKAMLVRAKEEYHIWSRGTGKSDGLIAPRTVENVYSMKRSLGVYVAKSFAQLLTRTLPPVIRGLERMGYIQGRDFFFGSFAPRDWQWDKPFFAPLSAKNFIHFKNGSGITLISQDRPGSANGLSIDWIIGDEAKYLNKERYEEELLPANRGNRNLFGHHPAHHSVMLCSDMPIGSEAKWLLQKKELMNEEYVKLILHSQLKANEYVEKIKTGKLTVTTKAKYTSEYNRLMRYANELRKKTVFYSEASAIDNIHVLGVEYIEQMRQTLPDMVFDTSILNKRIKEIENGFYPDFNRDKHCYSPTVPIELEDYNNGMPILDQDGRPITCKYDGDIRKDLPLIIGCDYGSLINTVVTGQKYSNKVKVCNGQYVKWPLKISDLAHKWCDYYEPHPTREVVYIYDHTAIPQNPINEITFASEWINILDKRGWDVNELYIGKAENHHSKYLFLSKLLKGIDPELPEVTYNELNCDLLINSIGLTPVRQGAKGFEKDKRAEGNPKIDQLDAPHFTDAMDTLLIGITEHLEEAQGGFLFAGGA